MSILRSTAILGVVLAVTAMTDEVRGGAAPGEAAPGVTFVIGQGYEAFFSDALNAAGAPGGWTLQGISLERSSASARYRARSGATATVILEHPDAIAAGKVATRRFRLRAEGEGGDLDRLVRHLAARIRAREGMFQWRADRPVVSRPGAMPTIPPDALPPNLLSEPTWDLGDSAAFQRFGEAREAIDAGKLAEARSLASALAAASPLAAASILRRIGDFGRAVEVLEQGMPSGGRSGSDRRDEDRALSLLLAGREADADRLLAGTPESLCRKAALWTRALREGRAADVARLAVGPLRSQQRPPRCVHQFRMRLAYALGDAAGIEAAGKAALAHLGPDDDLLFLWGKFYFDDFFSPASLAKATIPWRTLVRRNPNYPSILGIYATAEVQSGGLSRDRAFAYLDAWRKDRTDLVSAFLAGVGMHYLREFEPSIPALEAVYAGVPEEPRAGMYLAMAYYFTGRQARAEQVLDAIRDYAYQEPDIYYCRSSVWRHKDIQASRREMEAFLAVMDEPERFCFDPGKPARAREDLEAMRRGEVPPVRLPNSELEVRPGVP